MRSIVILCILSLCLFAAGCVPSMRQCKNMVKAINEQPVLTGYSKDYIMNEFGPPDSIKKSKSADIETETWTYKTNFKDRYFALNIKPVKTKYMKMVFADGRVLKVDFGN
ncbi:MAG: hypothetical protein Q8N91_05055 [Candidatus Omnitrophota bacterium]|nr:hypothetical protein [Candidatus Omnitrophota bacterium]